ncbi:MAG: hypothetical protein MI922_21085, partial [Bacteroidales bacterium]|nr:hypothetical protein [Bacteroidales bacterium]
MRRLTILVLLFFLCFQNIKSSIADGIDLYSVYNGLPSSNIQCLHIDSEGFLWIGTSDGLSKFDGYNFHNHFASDNALTSLQNDDIDDIVEDKRNNLVFLTKNGIEFFDIKKQIFIAKFQRHKHSIDELMYHQYDSNIYYCDYSSIGLYGYLEDKVVQQLVADSKISAELRIKPIDEVIWIMVGKKLIRYHLNQSRGQLFSSLDSYVSSSRIRNLVNIDSNTFAIINDFYIEFINKNTFRRGRKVPLPGKLKGTGQGELKTFRFSEHQVLIHNNKHISKFDLLSLTFENVYTSDKSKINDVLVDNSKVIWIATANGLLKIIPATQGFEFINAQKPRHNQQSWDYRLPNKKKIIQTGQWQLVDISRYKFGDTKNKTEITHLAPITNTKGIYFVALKNQFTVCNNGTFIYLNHDQLRNRHINYIHYGEDSLITLATSKGLVLSKLVTTEPLNIRIDKIIGDTLTFTKVIRRENRIYALELHSLVELSLSGDSISYNKIDDHVIDDCIINDIAVGQSFIWLATE